MGAGIYEELGSKVERTAWPSPDSVIVAAGRGEEQKGNRRLEDGWLGGVD